nr:endo alpha-1,4 polygalactosaminidase [Butyrivibrio sp.]
VVLTFTNSMLTFCRDRFLNVELITEDEKGLKIPNTSIVNKNFYLIPKEYVIKNNDNSSGVLRSRYNEQGTETSEFVNVSVYSENEVEYYIDTIELRSGDTLIKPDSTERFAVGKQDTLVGVYNINRLILGAYENWEGEYWVDVSDSKWQDFLVDEIASDMLKKGIDGFFIDNCDVYYVNHEKKIFDGLTAILKRLKKTGAKVIINGGDTYVSEYLEAYGNLKDVLDGVNQESVYTRINWDKGTFSESDPDDREYFLEYLANVKKAGKDVYVLEYTKDKNLANKATKACKKLGYTVYVSDSLELN